MTGGLVHTVAMPHWTVNVATLYIVSLKMLQIVGAGPYLAANIWGADVICVTCYVMHARTHVT